MHFNINFVFIYVYTIDGYLQKRLTENNYVCTKKKRTFKVFKTSIEICCNKKYKLMEIMFIATKRMFV